MSHPPVGPLFVLDDGDVIVVDTPEDVPRELEPWLADEPVQLFDAKARPLRMVTKGSVRKRWFVEVDERRTLGVEVVEEERQESRLRSALVAYLQRVGKDLPPDEDIESFARAAAALIK